MAAKKKTGEANIQTLREQLRTIKFSMAGSRSKNVKEAQMLRRQIARLLTSERAAKKN
jgi:ribosomal protein L29